MGSRVSRWQLWYGWNFMRVLRLVMGLFFTYEAIRTSDWFYGLGGGFFLFQAITNTGCCGVSSCYTPTVKGRSEEEIAFSEVKPVGENKDKLTGE